MKTTTYLDEIINIFSKKSEVRKFRKGAIIVTNGDQSDAIYLIQQGELKICLSDEDGKEAILNVIGAGESFGELAVFTGAPRSADVVARTDCELFIVSKEDYMAALRADPDLAIAASEYLAHMIQNLTEQVSSLALVDVFGRITALLKRRAADSEHGDMIEGLTHQDIAATVGASREMVSKIIGDLKKGGYIAAQRKKITLLKTIPKGW